MTDESRIIKTVAIPLSIAVVFLFLLPKMCSKMLTKKPIRAQVATVMGEQPTDTALHIRSDSPDAAPSAPVSYPTGLDPQKAQYLIEINQRFSDPYSYRLPKPGSVISLADTAIADALVRAGWFEEVPGGGYNPTHEAALHIPQLGEESQAWRVPLAARKFGSITSVQDLGENRAKVGFTWQWDPNEAGRAVKSTFEMHHGTADFAGGGEHPWDLNSVIVDNDWR